MAGLAWGLSLVRPPRAARAENVTTGTTAAELARTLRSIGGPVCLDVAKALEALPERTHRFSLHLRQAGLDQIGAGLLADVLGAIKARKVDAIASLSVSFNPGIGDLGGTAIANALPESLPELGMVGCNIGDQTGKALLRWAQAAPHLHTLCIERNRFSAEMETRFDGLARQRTNMLVVI